MPNEARQPYTGYAYADARPPQQKTTALGYYLDILRRRFWIVLSILVVAGSVGTIRAFKAPRIFESGTKLLVERQTSRLMKFDGVVEGYGGWDPDFYSTRAELIRSRVVMEAALTYPGVREMFEPRVQAGAPDAQPSSLLGELRKTLRAALGTPPAAPPAPWEMLRNEIMTEVLKGTHFIVVRVRGQNPKRTALLANAAADAFVEYYQNQRAETLGDAFAYLEREKRKEEQALRAAEKELQDFGKQAKGVPLGTSEDYQPAKDKLVALNQRLTAVQLERSALGAQIEVMRDVGKFSGDPATAEGRKLFSIPVIQTHAGIGPIREALVEAQKRAATLTQTYGPQHPRLREAQADVVMLWGQFKETLNQCLLADASRLKILEKEEADLARQYDAERTSALDVAREAFTFTHLRNAVERHRKLFDAIVQRMLEVDISSGYSATNVEVVERASEPKSPINAGRNRRIVFSLALGVFLGMALAFFVENLDDSVKTPEDLKERLDVPMLGFVPHMPLFGLKRSKGAARPTALVSAREPTSSAAEAYRHVRTNLFYSIPAGEVKTLAVTSCSPREGKTTTACNLAVSIAQSGKRVMLLDCDFHRPMLQNVFGVDNKAGLANVLVGEKDMRDVALEAAVDGAKVANLTIVPAGPPSPSPGELLGSHRMRDLLAQAREAYDWVVLDTPPIMFVSESSVLSRLCDGVVIVVRSGRSNRSLLRRAREQLEGIHVRIVGSILNGGAMSRLGRYYSAYYYHGHSRYARDYSRSYYRDRTEPGEPE